jgi:hypothetical protein
MFCNYFKHSFFQPPLKVIALVATLDAYNFFTISEDPKTFISMVCTSPTSFTTYDLNRNYFDFLTFFHRRHFVFLGPPKPLKSANFFCPRRPGRTSGKT